MRLIGKNPQSEMNKIRTVCVYSASSPGLNDCYGEAARRLGELLAQHHLRLVNGAGAKGLMRAVADAVLSHGGEAVGVIPRFMVERGWHYPGMTRLVEVETMHERKQVMARLSDGVIALPGGCGTLEELLEIITWKQLGLYPKPIVILNVNSFFSPLLEMFGKAISECFMRGEHEALWQVAATPEEALRLLFATPLWNPSVGKFSTL